MLKIRTLWPVLAALALAACGGGTAVSSPAASDATMPERTVTSMPETMSDTPAPEQVIKCKDSALRDPANANLFRGSMAARERQARHLAVGLKIKTPDGEFTTGKGFPTVWAYCSAPFTVAPDYKAALETSIKEGDRQALRLNAWRPLAFVLNKNGSTVTDSSGNDLTYKAVAEVQTARGDREAFWGKIWMTLFIMVILCILAALIHTNRGKIGAQWNRWNAQNTRQKKN